MTVGRFQVMAVLQASRAYVLGLPLEMSFSWGLNRAIFYAAAKRGFKRKKSPTGSRSITLEVPVSEEKDRFFLGDEMAYKVEDHGKTYFSMDSKPQTAEDFRRQIVTRFGNDFETIWREAIDSVKKFDRKVLLSQHEFYEQVYRPQRDELAQKWSELTAQQKQ